MSTLVVGLVLLSALIHASWNAMVKGRTGEPLVASTGLSLAWAGIGVPVGLVVGLPDVAALPYLGASALVHVVYFGLLNRAYREGELSVVYTIARGAPPLLVTVGALVVAGEQPGPVALLGIALIVCGVVTLGLGPGALATERSRRVVLFALGTAVCIATYTLIDALGARADGDALVYVVWLVALQGALFTLAVTAVRGRAILREASRRWKLALGAGVLSAVGYGIALWAMTRAPIAPVAALRETSVLFAALLGTLVLHEPFGRRRVIAALLVAAGAVAVRIG